MMFSGDGWRAGLQRAATIVATALVLASCGGGEQVKKFVPTRVLAFGDETSVIESDGRKYTINFLAAPTTDVPNPTIDCAQLLIWVQVVAANYALPFRECGGAPTSPSRILAAANTRVADVGTQVDTFLLTDSFVETDLVTVLAGANDIVALYERTVGGAYSIDQAAADAEAAGTALAGQVNRIAKAGGKVLISTVPDLSLTPYGRADADKAAALHRLTQRFNAKLRTGLVNDGRMIGLVLFDETVQAIVNTGNYNTTDPACNDATLADVRTCTSQTLRVTADGTTASTSTWLWADKLHISPVGHSNLGSIAVARAIGNPF